MTLDSIRNSCDVFVHPFFIHPIFCTSYFWCFLSLRFPSFICGSFYQCVLFLYILVLVLPIFEVPIPNSVVPNFSRSYVWCFLLLRSYLCVFLSLCYPVNGVAPFFCTVPLKSSATHSKAIVGGWT